MSEKTVDNGINQLGEIARNTNNDAIVMYVAIAISVIVLFVVCITLYTLYSRRDKDKLNQYIQREDRILNVIEKNGESNVEIAKSNMKVAEAIISLKVTLDTNNRHCDTCKTEQTTVLGVIMGKQDNTNLMVTEIKTILKERKDNHE